MNNVASYSNLIHLLISRVPELRGAYDDEIRDWNGESPGPHIIFADVLSPYLVKLLDDINDDTRLIEIFDFLESLAVHPDRRVGDVIALSVLDPLRNQGKRTQMSRYLQPYMAIMLEELENW